MFHKNESYESTVLWVPHAIQWLLNICAELNTSHSSFMFWYREDICPNFFQKQRNQNFFVWSYRFLCTKLYWGRNSWSRPAQIFMFGAQFLCRNWPNKNFRKKLCLLSRNQHFRNNFAHYYSLKFLPKTVLFLLMISSNI
jgi:hypothetical protein